jgi:hypothetical protein
MGTLGKILKSKTVWGASFLGAMLVLPAIFPIIPAGTKASAAIGLVLMGFTIYSRIKAKQPLGPIIDKTIADTMEAVHTLGIADPPPTPTGKVAEIAEVKAVVKEIQKQGSNDPLSA